MKPMPVDTTNGAPSLEARLLNLRWCSNDKSNKQLFADFEGNGTINTVSYADLDTVHASLSKAVIHICERFRDSADRCIAIRSLVAFLICQYVDLKAAGYEDSGFPYITCITSMERDKNSGYVYVGGLNFSVEKVAGVRFPRVYPNPHSMVLLSPETMDNLWANSTQHILIMEELGYSKEDVAAHILNNSFDVLVKTDLNGIDFS